VKIKICPQCKTENRKESNFCKECRFDLKSAKMMKECLFCGEYILEKAIKCKHCGEWFVSRDNVRVDHILKKKEKVEKREIKEKEPDGLSREEYKKWKRQHEDKYIGLNQRGFILFIVLFFICMPICWLPWVFDSCKIKKK